MICLRPEAVGTGRIWARYHRLAASRLTTALVVAAALALLLRELQ